MVPFYEWGSTASRLVPLRGGSLLFTTKFPNIYGTHFMDLTSLCFNYLKNKMVRAFYYMLKVFLWASKISKICLLAVGLGKQLLEKQILKIIIGIF